MGDHGGMIICDVIWAMVFLHMEGYSNVYTLISLIYTHSFTPLALV